MKYSKLLIAFFVLILITGVGLLYYKYQLPDTELINSKVTQRLLKIDGLNSNVSNLALRSRINIDTNYDLLARSTTLLDQEIQKLEIDYFNDSIQKTELKKQFVVFKDQIQAKKELIENFKSHNSVLRNSEKYAPIVGRKLMLTAEENELFEIAKIYRKITHEILEYSRQGAATKAVPLTLWLSQISETESQMPEEELSHIIEFSNHISTVINEKEETDIYLRQALLSDNQLKELFNAWSQWVSIKNKSQEKLTLLVQIYIFFLIAFIILITLQLRALYVSLDAQVAEQTAEAKIAYDELRQSEKRLMQSEKMASLGQLIAGVAHEVNTPLGYITGNIDTIGENINELQTVLHFSKTMSDLVNKQPIDKQQLNKIVKSNILSYRKIEKQQIISETEELLQDSLYGLKQISQLVISLNKFSHPGEEEINDIDIHVELDATLGICQNMFGNRALIKNYSNDLPQIKVRATQLAQVFMNILNNAIQATDKDKGVITVETQKSDDCVSIIFKDNGHGMDKETCERIFDPFFTTKGINQGIGLGMSISYKIIESHSGSISVESEPDKGTQMIINLPYSII